ISIFINYYLFAFLSSCHHRHEPLQRRRNTVSKPKATLFRYRRATAGVEEHGEDLCHLW
ncbi:hypothetical protein A2U01_0081625, partial [Trifolium medium]|nr:hypothetical protein [Trifolium medium]